MGVASFWVVLFTAEYLKVSPWLWLFQPPDVDGAFVERGGRTAEPTHDGPVATHDRGGGDHRCGSPRRTSE